MSKPTPQFLTVVVQNSAVTVLGDSPGAPSRVLVYGDSFEVSPYMLEVLGADWVDRVLASGKYVSGTCDDNPEVRERREQIDADALDRLTRYQRTGL